MANHKIKHGFNNHPLYNIYRHMLKRCYKPNNPEYKNYGGRGIKICTEWLKEPRLFFEWAIKSGSQKGLQIDRFPNNNGDYEPSNCRWATPKENSNNKRNSVRLSFNGEVLSILEWSEKLGIPAATIATRKHVGMPIDKILCPDKLKTTWNPNRKQRPKGLRYKTRSQKNS